MSGTLYIVGTPIGNLGDLTLRAIETLREVDRIFAEDTRRTRALLSHLEIHNKPVHRLDAHATPEHVHELGEFVERGEKVALVSDAGMPLISDPGATLVRELTARGLRLEVVPGPSAVSAAVALSGLVTGPFLFLGFLPRQGSKRRALLERIARAPEPIVLFEAPTRARQTLRELAELSPGRAAVVCRELTKMYEQVHRGTLAELAATESWRGELTLVLGELSEESVAEQERPPPDDAALEARIAELLQSGAATKAIAGELAAWTGLPRRELYARVQAAREKAGG
ncbi:MAG TPA: 16S rRNA (cytidine(1402)-2'-O)-methyltransferase [Polyangiaceae bacterium]|nr:16S rRNA (cytidine(1402)-2'-O)-methyltransferase [Polyangiaceae bacterium]